MNTRLDDILHKYEDITVMLADPEVTSNQKRYTELSREFSEIEPVAEKAKQQSESIRQDELLKAQRYLKDLSPEQQEAVERFSRSLMKRFLHPSLRSLKSLPEDMEGDLLMGAARKLFGVELKPVETSSATQHKESDEHTSG